MALQIYEHYTSTKGRPNLSDSLSDKDAFSGAETDGTDNTIFSSEGSEDSEDSDVVHEVKRGRRLKSEWESFVPSDRSPKRDTRYFGHERRSPSPGARRREIRYPLRDVKTRSIGDRARYLSPMAYREHRHPRTQYHYNDRRDKQLSVDRYPSAYGNIGFADREPKDRYHDDKQYLNRLLRDREHESETQSNVIEADLLGDDGEKLRMDDEKVMLTRGKRKDISSASLVSSKSHEGDAKITKLIEGSRLLSGRRAKNPHSARDISPSLSSAGAGEAEDMSNRGSCFSESASNPATTDELDSSDETQSISSNNDAGLVVVYAKHQMLVRLMQEVYSLFDPSWSTNSKARTHGGSSSDASSTKFGGPNANDRSSRKNGKRPLRERNSSPFDDDDQNNKKRRSKELKRLDREPRFACPFHKFDPRKYRCNDIDGFKYRACAGPGFTSIARLKQHLKRTHGAPLQCQRCWQIMSDSQAMINHANDEIRCERREAQPLGIPQHKMDLIHSKHGPSWEAIFDILFPGAPVPSPYHEISTHSLGNTGTLPLSSQELADFEAYNRTALPLLVEANLQAIIDAEVAPIEENLRNLVVDIVRRCQSTVSQNYQSFQGSVPSSGPSTAGTNTLDKSKAPQETMSTTFPTHGSTPGEASGASWFFNEPPLLDAEASDAASRTLCDGNGSLHRSSQNYDSGYGSLRDICKCECHDKSDGVNGCYEEKYCEICARYHIAYDGDMNFDEFIDLPHF